MGAIAEWRGSDFTRAVPKTEMHASAVTLSGSALRQSLQMAVPHSESTSSYDPEGSQSRQEDPPTAAFEVEAPFEIANVWQTSPLDWRPNLERYLYAKASEMAMRSQRHRLIRLMPPSGP
jgi:hypothetical protein